MSRPLISPISAPTLIVATTATSAGHLAMLISARAVKLASAKLEPTLRSMPPVSMTIVMPITINPNSPICREVSTMLPSEKKFGIASVKKTVITSRSKTGIALSIHFLPSNSPTIWSGTYR